MQSNYQYKDTKNYLSNCAKVDLIASKIKFWKNNDININNIDYKYNNNDNNNDTNDNNI